MSTGRRMSALNRTRDTRVAASVRVADTHWSRLLGLMGTSAADFQPGQGLWILPCHGVHTFAMGFPLDLIYLDRECAVVEVLEAVKPWRIAPVRMRAASVLELPPGSVRGSGTQTGDRIEMTAVESAREGAA